MITESYKEWALQIQKLKERNSHLFGSDQINETENDNDKDKAKKEEE